MSRGPAGRLVRNQVQQSQPRAGAAGDHERALAGEPDGR